jgi:hypothetical protein
MATDDVNPGGQVGVQPLPVTEVAAVPRGHNHDDEHVIGEDKSVGLIEDPRRAAESPDPSRRLFADGRAGARTGGPRAPGEPWHVSENQVRRTPDPGGAAAGWPSWP